MSRPARAAGSVQQRQYLALRRFGHGRADAATAAGVPIAEAKLIDRECGL